MSAKSSPRSWYPESASARSSPQPKQLFLEKGRSINNGENNDDTLIKSIKNMISQQTHQQLIEHLHDDIAFLRTEVSQKHVIISDYLSCLKSELASINQKLVESNNGHFNVAETDLVNSDGMMDEQVFVGDDKVKKIEESILLGDGNIKKPTFALNYKTNLQYWLDDYIQSLTIHGLTRSLKGKNKESAFWTIILLVGLGFALFVVGGLLKKYGKYQVYTQLKSEVTHQNKFPSVTFCEKHLLQKSYFAYCGQSLKINEKSINCSQSDRKKALNFTRQKISWTESPFQITECNSNGNKACNSSAFFKSNPNLNNSCITWNYKGDYYDTYGHVNIRFDFRKPDYERDFETEIFVIPHDPKILELDATKKLGIDPNYKYEIKVDKILIKRLPHPFPSNCTEYTSANIFPGRYSRFLCIESHHYVDMFKKCGDIFDYLRQYIPENIVKQYGRNNSNIVKCLEKYTRTRLSNIKHCPLSCKSYEFKYFWTFQANSVNRSRYDVTIQLKNPNEYDVMEEKQLYTLRQMLCEVGGFVGLIMGMSVISLIEVAVVLIFSVIKRFTKA